MFSNKNFVSLRVNLPLFKKEVLENSFNYKSLLEEKKSIQALQNLITSTNKVQLNFEAQYKYLSQVPEMNFPFNNHVKLGDNTNYSIGPTLTYLLYDNGQLKYQIESSERNSEAKDYEIESLKKETETNSEIQFYKTQLIERKIKFVLESYIVGKNQLNDIKKRLTSGALSRLDYLTAQKDLHELKAKLLLAQSDFSAELIEIEKMKGNKGAKGALLKRPLPLDLKKNCDELSELNVLLNPSIYVQLSDSENNIEISIENPNKKKEELLANSRDKDNNKENKQSDWLAHPKIKALEKSYESQISLSKSAEADEGLKISLQARSSIDYPNGSEKSSFNQNSFSVNLRYPLYDGGKNNHLFNQKIAEAQKINFKRQELQENLLRESEKIQQKITSLQQQTELYTEGLKDLEEWQALTYQTYTNGRIPYTQVQVTNLKVLDWKINLENLLTQIKMQKTIYLHILGQGSEK